MDVNNLFPSKYLKASDATPSITLTVKGVTWEKMKDKDGNEEEKPVIYFNEQTKGMVLNRTNANTLTHLYGSETDKWVGQRVVLGTEIVTAFGESKPALRFKNEEVKYDRASLLKRHAKLFAEAKELGIDDLETFVLDAGATDQTILEVGKELRLAVDAAKAF
jgi:hypothetical protein